MRYLAELEVCGFYLWGLLCQKLSRLRRRHLSDSTEIGRSCIARGQFVVLDPTLFSRSRSGVYK